MSLHRYLGAIGYKSVFDFILKLVLPVLGGVLAFYVVTLFVTLFPWYFPLVALGIGVLFIIIYPIMSHEKIRMDIQENIHLFITYAGTISTLDIDRSTFFKKISAGNNFGFISQTSSKILYLAKAWNLGYASACRKVATFSPSKVFEDFLDRFATIMDFGGDIGKFMIEEQDSMLAAYSSEYKQAINNIGMLREVFIALTISMAFGISAALLLPLLMGISMLVVVQWSLLALAIIDFLMIVIVKSFIPSDDLCHHLPAKDKGTKKIYKAIVFIAPVSALIMFILFYYDLFPFLVRIALGVTPFTIVGYFAAKEETEVFERDKAYPSFIRSLGTTIYARQGGVSSSLTALRVHDFGVLNDMVINLDRRLKVRSDRDGSWYHFAAESGSNLIVHFTHIFSDSVYSGGHAQKIGEIISKNFMKLLSLRTLREQMASGLRGALYGALIGFIATLYITIEISNILFDMFSSAFDQSAVSGNIGSLASAIIPTVAPVNAELIGMYIGLLVIFHALISSIAIKMVDGGNRFAFFFDFTLMIWLGAAISWFVPLISVKLFAPAITGG